jgi:hypothetical protein
VQAVKLYWFDDTGRGECRVPDSWKLQALTDGQWRDVATREGPIVLNKWDEMSFKATRTAALRVLIRQKAGFASGVHEWKVVVSED